jgi:DNA-binding transcriptional LysR family regulator
MTNKAMDRFDAMRVFTRVVERRSFTLAAQDLGLPRSTVTDAVKQLEERLGVRLLQRTTRHVGAESYVAAARLGLGLIQVPRYHVEGDLERGTLVPILLDCPPSPTPVSLLYPRSRQLSPRVRVFIDWLVRAFDAGRSPRAGTDGIG